VPTIRLSPALGSQISHGSRTRGHSYFIAGAVRALTVENGIIEATVRGTGSYAVWIEPDGPRLRASCTCPFFIDRFEICKHIWAVILAAEAQSIPLVLPDVAAHNVRLEPLWRDEYEANDIWPALAQPLARRRQPTEPPAWKQLLDSVSASGSAPFMAPVRVTAAPLIYVVDAAASVISGSVVVELMTRVRKANGDWGKPRPARVTAAEVESQADPEERHLLERLLGPRPHLGWSGGWGYGSELSRVELRGAVSLDLVPLLCATGRCMLRAIPEPGSSQSAPLAPIAWDSGPPWIFAIAIKASETDASYTVDGWLARGDDRMALTEPALVLDDGILLTRTHAARVNVGGAFAWLAALHRAGRIAVPRDARDQLIDALLLASPHLADVPDDLRIEAIHGQPRPMLMLRPTHRPDRIRAELAFDYEGTVVAMESPQRLMRLPGSTRAIRRDVAFEQRAQNLLFESGCRSDWNDEAGDRVPQFASHALPRAVRQLLGEGWHVEASGRVYRQPGPSALALRSGIDWFELHGHVEYGDQRASLPSLLAALNRGDAFVTLGDGTLGVLPEEWLQRHGTLASLGKTEGDHLRFTQSQVALLDALIAVQPQISWDETFDRARADLQAFEGIQPVDPPSAFVGTLRGYQREGLGWLMFLERFGFGGCLADDMGLGKTVMVLALLSGRAASRGAGPRPSLVVAPRSVVFNWRQEAARFAPGLRVLEYVGTGRAAMRETVAEHDIVLTTYGTLRRDAETLSAIPFDYIVLDESQAIKNAASVSAKTTRVLNARHRLALSGTPIENHLGELWSLFEFLNPGLLGSAAAFHRTGTGERLDDDALALLARGLRPFILRRTKEQVASDLPQKTEQTLYCELERPQRAMYDELLAHYRRTLLKGTHTEALGRDKLRVLEALLRLRQAACHPGLIDRRRVNEPSAKLDVLVPRLTEAVEEGHKTIVFSQFTSLLAILRSRLDGHGIAYEYLDGRTRDRQSRVERFQRDPECRLFLISLKAGGLGLNLTAAEYVFLLDPWWNPAVEAQAIDRAHRIGQERHVFAYRLIARDTVEERVLELQQRKRRLADAILTADSGIIRDLRWEDLELLLS
jgi:superfamily II DNA or RNA helicase